MLCGSLIPRPPPFLFLWLRKPKNTTGTSIVWALFCLPATIDHTCLDKVRTHSGCTTMPLQWLYKCCFDKDATWCTKQTRFTPWLCRFCFAKNAFVVSKTVLFGCSSTKLDWLEDNQYSYLPHNWIDDWLDWIYCSIRTMTVYSDLYLALLGMNSSL